MDKTLHLPQLVSEEFGVSQSIAREQIVLGMVLIDGKEVRREYLLDIPSSAVEGKTIEVKGRDRSFKFVYTAPEV